MKSGINNYFIKIFLSIFMIAAIIVIIHCGGGGGGNGSDAQPDKSSQYVVYTNPTDDRLFEEIKAEGTSITYHGTKDSEGNPLSLDFIVVQDPTIEGEFIYMLSEDNMHERIYAPEGIVFELERISDISSNLKILSEDGELQFLFPIPLQSKSKKNMIGSRASITTSGSVFNLYLSKCGKPVENAFIEMMITPKIGKAYPIGFYLGDGWYSFNIPKVAEKPLSEEYIKKCEKIGEHVRTACGLWPIISSAFTSANPCDNLDGAFVLLKLNIELKYWKKEDQKKKKEILAEVESKFSQIKKYCRPALIKLIPKICEINEVYDFSDICKANRFSFIEPDSQATYTYSLNIKIPGSKAYSTALADFDPNNSYNMEFEAPTEILCEKIYTVPSNPKTTEWYTARASMTCPDPVDGTDVTISVVGSDGYEGSFMDTIFVDSEIELDIPAVTDEEDIKKGVTDTIMVEAENKNWIEPVRSSRHYLSVPEAELTNQKKRWIMVVKKDAESNDADGDGYTVAQGDCNDANANINPGASEICNDGVDNNCNDQADCDDSVCENDSSCQTVCDSSSGIYVWYVENLPLKDVFVTSCESYFSEDALCGYPGGGLDCSIKAEKVLLGSGYVTTDEAVNTTCSTVSNIRPCGSTWSCGWLGDIGGIRHVIDGLGGCQ